MKRIPFVGLAAILVLTALAACVPAADMPTAEAAAAEAQVPAGLTEAAAVNTGDADLAAIDAMLGATTPGELSPEEAAGLVFMREEEKRDPRTICGPLSRASRTRPARSTSRNT